MITDVSSLVMVLFGLKYSSLNKMAAEAIETILSTVFLKTTATQRWDGILLSKYS